MAFDNNQDNPDKDQNKDVKSPQDNGESNASQDHTKVFLAVGERAFKDPDSVAKHIEHAQNHIKTLEGERKQDQDMIASLTAELERLKKVESAIKSHSNPGTDDQTDHLSKEQLAEYAAKLAMGMIEQSKTQEQLNKNLKDSENKAKEVFGDKYKEVVSSHAEKLGMSLKAVDALASQSPEAFKRLFIEGKAGQSLKPTSSDVTTPHNNNPTEQRRNIMKMSDKERREYVASLLRQ